MATRSFGSTSSPIGPAGRDVWKDAATDRADLRQSLEFAARGVCQATGWPLAHLLVLDDAGEKLVSSGFWHGDESDAYRAWREARAAQSFGPGEGLAGTIWRSRQPARGEVTADGSSTSGAAPACAFGFGVWCGDNLAAVIEFFHPDSGADSALLERMAALLAHVLGSLASCLQLAADRAEMAAMVEASDDAIIATDVRGTIRSWNSGAERLYGYTRAEALGKSLELIVPNGALHNAPVLTRVLRDARRLEQFETVRRRKNGQLVDVALTAAPILDREGRVKGASSIERDISRRKRFEAERAKAQADAESANRAKSEFLANVSHELRTPMNAILGMLELALEEQLPATVQDYLATAHDSARVLLFLLNDLLDFSRTETGTFELESSPFPLRRTIRQATRALSVRAHEKGLEMACRIHEDVPDHLEGDARRVRQIVMNLAGNAIKFTDSGEVVVEVAAHSQQADSVELLLSVSDTGIGISPADQERIFLPFTQVDSTSTRRHSGTGLGLTIARELVRRMSGNLWVESDLGRGSRFLCTLRLKRGMLDSAAQAALAPRPQLVGKRVLIVDDNAASRKVIQERLVSWSMRPTACPSGAEALHALRQASTDQFALVIVDAMMPAMDGFMFVEAARRESILGGASIVMLSSSAQPSHGEACRKLGIALYLEKPVSQLELLDAATAAVDGTAAPKSSSRLAEPAARPLRILVAEDTPANQKVVKALLSKRGHTVEIVENGLQAVDRIQKAVFDVVLMDAQMPTMNGLQATAAIRHIPNADRARVPIVAMTAHAMREDREKCLAAGMDDYLAKPVDAAELIRVVEYYGSRRGASNADQGRLARDDVMSRSPSHKPFDLQAAMERFGGNRELVRQLIVLFRDEAQRLGDAVREAVDARDLAAAARAAHNLCGVALNLDAAPTVAAARGVEEAADAGAADDAQAALAVLEVELARLRAALAQVDF
jgi:PAS domain S-box-containing protein